jgi:ribosome-associated protein
MLKYKIPSNEFIFTFSRSSGAGGQNVNKVNSKVTLQWNPLASIALPKEIVERFVNKYEKKLNEGGLITLVSQKHRSQNLNSADVIEKFYAMIMAVAEAPKLRRKTKPTRASVTKRLNSKKVLSDKKKSRLEKF